MIDTPKLAPLSQWLDSHAIKLQEITTETARTAAYGGMSDAVYAVLNAEENRSPEEGLLFAELAIARGHYQEALNELQRSDVRGLDETGTYFLILECCRHIGDSMDPDPSKTWCENPDFDAIMARTMVSFRDWPTFFILINKAYAEHGDIIWSWPAPWKVVLREVGYRA